MALIRFISPFTKITKTKQINIDANNVRELCEKLIDIYGSDMSILLDKEGNLSKNLMVLVNRRNAHTLQGADTLIEEDNEVLIMPYILGG